MRQILIASILSCLFIIANKVNGQFRKKCDSTLAILPTFKEDTIKVNALISIAACKTHPDFGRNYDSMFFYLNQAQALAENLNYKKGIAGIYFMHSQHYANGNRDLNKAIKYSFLAAQIAEEANDKKNAAVGYNNVGAYYRTLNNLPKALEAYMNSMKNGGTKGTKFNIAGIYEKMNREEEALKIYYDGLQLSQQQKDFFMASHVAINIANLYTQLKNYNKAFEYYNMVLSFPQKEAGYKSWAYRMKSHLYKTMADSMINHKSNAAVTNIVIDSAITSLNSFKKEINFDTKNQLWADACMLDADLLILKGRLVTRKLSTKFFDSALAMYNKLHADTLLSRRVSNYYKFNKHIANIYLLKGDYKSAYDYQQKYQLATDSIYSDESRKKMEQLKTEYEVETAVTKERIEKERLVLQEKIKFEKELIDEKLKQEKATAEEKARHERVLLEENFRHQTALAEQKIKEEQLLIQQKLKGEKAVVEERALLQKREAEEKLRHEKALYQEYARHNNEVAMQKNTQDRLIAAKEKRNDVILMGSGLLFLSGIFSVLFIRQRSAKKRALEKAESMHKLAELEMQSLRTQLNPHFMFNSLNSIQELILLEENDKSHSYLARFSKLLRMLLDNAERPFISLQKEMDFLQLYLGLENLRVPNLEYSISKDPEINTDDVLIPNMILQPYIENAIWHGLSHKTENKQLTIRIYKQNGSVNYEIEDNGVGRKKAAELKSLFRKQHHSKGMELLSKRFRLLNEQYSSNIETSITDVLKNNEVAGTLVTIKVPIKLTEYSLN